MTSRCDWFERMLKAGPGSAGAWNTAVERPQTTGLHFRLMNGPSSAGGGSG